MKTIEDIHICVNSSDGTHSVERTIPLAEKGFKISLIAHNEFDSIERLEKFDNVDVYILSKVKPDRKFNRLSVYTNLIKKLNPDLIIIHFCGYDRFQSAVFSGVKIKVGILMGGDVDTHNCEVPLSTFLEFRFTRMFLPYFDLLGSKTNKIINLLNDWGLNGKIVHIPWGVKISDELKVESSELRSETKEEFKKELRLKLGLPLDKFLVLSNRNVAESGRQLEILRGFHELVREGLNVYLIIVVRTNLYSYLTKLNDYIAENGLSESVKILEYIPQKNMFDYYYACDVLVSNWVHDGLPQTFFEASIRGLPIIMNDLPQYKDYYVDKISAYINDGTPEGFSDCLKTAYNDKDLLMKISDNGINVVKEKANFDKWSDYFINELLLLIESDKRIIMPSYKIFLGKILVVIIVMLRRWPFSKIMIKV